MSIVGLEYFLEIFRGLYDFLLIREQSRRKYELTGEASFKSGRR
jgi:hypothetical protein